MGVPIRSGIIVVLGTLLGLTACITAPEDRAWIHAETESFQIYSQLSARETVELGEKLETFRELTRVLTNAASTAFEPVIPTYVYAFGSSGDYRQYAPPRSAGYIAPRQRANYIALNARERDLQPERIIYHEFVHYLLRNGSRGAYPRWIDEGMAEYLAGTEIDDRFVTTAMPLEDRLRNLFQLPRLSLERLVKAGDTSRWSSIENAMLYAQSWALVHYLNRGANVGMPDRRAQLPLYLRLLNEGVPTDEAFRQAFETSFDELESELSSYLRKGTFSTLRLERENLPTPRAPVVRPAPKHEVAQHLGNLALQLGEAERARRLYSVSLELEPASSQALSGLGRALVASEAEDPGVVREYLESAVSTDPTDALAHLDLANFLLTLARGDVRHPSYMSRLQAARDAYARAIELDPGLPEPYAQAATLYTLPEQDWRKGLPLIEAAYTLLPTDLGILVTLSAFYVRDGQYERAEELLNVGSQWAIEAGGEAATAVARVRSDLARARRGDSQAPSVAAPAPASD